MLLFIWKILKRNVAVYMEKQLLITLILMSKTGNLKEHLYFYNWYKSCLLFYSWCILWYIGSVGYRVKRLSILTWTVNCKFIFWKDSDVKKTFCWWELFVYSFHLLWYIYIYIGIFTAIFLIQYFCWHGIFPFFKSYSVIENTWLVKTNIKRNCFVKLWKSTICATFCVKSKWRSVLHEVKSVLCEVKSTWRSEMKERSPMLTLDTFR